MSSKHRQRGDGDGTCPFDSFDYYRAIVNRYDGFGANDKAVCDAYLFRTFSALAWQAQRLSAQVSIRERRS